MPPSGSSGATSETAPLRSDSSSARSGEAAPTWMSPASTPAPSSAAAAAANASAVAKTQPNTALPKGGSASRPKFSCMDSDKARSSGAKPASGVLVGRNVTIRRSTPEPPYYTDVHRRRVGETGRVHAIVAGASKKDPLVKVGFEDGTTIVFFRLSEIDVRDDGEVERRQHGKRGSHLPPSHK